MKVNTAGLFSLAHAAPAQDVDNLEDFEVVEDEGPPAPPRAEAVAAPRMRKTTLEHFNEEMAVLDRPLEGEVEFYDEPKPRRWRVPAIGAAIFLVSCGTYLGVLRHRSAAEAAAAPAPAPVVATVPAVAATPPVAAVPGPAPTAAPAGPAASAPAAAAPPSAGASRSVVAEGSDSGAHHHHHHARGGSAHHHHHGGHAHHGRA